MKISILIHFWCLYFIKEGILEILKKKVMERYFGKKTVTSSFSSYCEHGFSQTITNLAKLLCLTDNILFNYYHSKFSTSTKKNVV